MKPPVTIEFFTEKVWISLVLTGIATLVFWDAITDMNQGASTQHITTEILVVLMAVMSLLLIWLSTILSLRRKLGNAVQDREKLRSEAESWKQNVSQLAQGLSNMIDQQFDIWSLTPAEKEVSLLLLKGISIKEIAQIRQVSDRTVKQQNLAIYKKSKLTGRAELSAFFLEDLLLSPLKPSANSRSQAQTKALEDQSC